MRLCRARPPLGTDEGNEKVSLPRRLVSQTSPDNRQWRRPV